MDRTIHIFWYVELNMDRTVYIFWYIELYMDRTIHTLWYVDLYGTYGPCNVCDWIVPQLTEVHLETFGNRIF